MSSRPHDSVPVEVLPPLPDGADETASSSRPHAGERSTALSTPHTLQGFKTFYHPISGVIILGVDMLAFGSELLTGFLDLVPLCILSFIVVFIGVIFTQRHWGKDGWFSSFGKAFVGAFLAGLPFSITGTMLGAAILMLSGLPEPKEALKKLGTEILTRKP